MTAPFNAWHLPDGAVSPGGPWVVRDGDGKTGWRVPDLAPGDLETIAGSLRRNRAEHLANRPVTDIVDAIDAVAARFTDADDPVRRTARDLLPGLTGFAPAMVDLVLDRMAADWQAPALRRLLEVELPDPAALDRFVPDPRADRLVHAAGPDLLVHVLAGNVPGVTVTSLVRALLVKSASLARIPRAEPVLAPLFAHALAGVDRGLGSCIGLTWWPRERDDLTRAALADAGAVVVYGGPDAIAAASSHAPAGVPILDHGPRVSFGFVAREALIETGSAARTAAAVAEATALFDQQGCVSPHLVYVERGQGTDPRAFAGLVADALERLGARIPPGRRSTAEAAAIHRARAAAEFRAIAGHDTELFAAETTAATIIYEGDPAFSASPLNRVLRVKPLDDLDRLPDLLLPVRTLLQTAGYAGPTDRIAALAPRLTAAGVTRIAPFDAMAFPPPFWHHDGRGPLSELLRWTDLETAR